MPVSSNPLDISELFKDPRSGVIMQEVDPVEQQKQPFCVLCGRWAVREHLRSPRHAERVQRHKQYIASLWKAKEDRQAAGDDSQMQRVKEQGI